MCPNCNTNYNWICHCSRLDHVLNIGYDIRATGHTVMNVMIRPGHGKMCYIYLVTDTFSNWIPKLKLLGVKGSTSVL